MKVTRIIGDGQILAGGSPGEIPVLPGEGEGGDELVRENEFGEDVLPDDIW